MAKAASASASKKALHKRTKLEWVLLAILLLIAWLFLANRYGWWPSNNGNSENLGTAFYISKRLPLSSNASTQSGGDLNGTSGSNGSGSNGSGNGSGSSTSSTSRILSFAAGVDNGKSKDDVDGGAGGLDENCAVVANASSLGKQEVCTYREGDKLVTVTYLDNHVVSASRSGF